jgi:uncharacterized protein YodC (DUF2158 family)
MKDGGPAFPVPAELCQDLTVQEQRGMTLCDWFAGMALMGMMASRNPSSPKFTPEMDAVYVYAVARSMLAERSKT